MEKPISHHDLKIIFLPSNQKQVKISLSLVFSFERKTATKQAKELWPRQDFSDAKLAVKKTSIFANTHLEKIK